MSRIVIAFGGNALGSTPEEQQKLIKHAVKNILPLIKDGHEIIIGHGNGPQVGTINLAFEDSYENKDIPYMPLPECTAMSQGYIGYHLQKELRKVLEDEHLDKEIITIITQVTVDKDDPSFHNPTKPIGPFYTKEMADKLMEISGETYIEDAGRGYRKVVASPKPIDIVEIKSIKQLLDSNHIIIAGGGGGIPVYQQDKTEGAPAVIDKDLLCALMATKLDADFLIILTNVNQVQIDYNTENARSISQATVSQMKRLIEEGHFAKGSMLPKVQASINFVEATGKIAVITDLNNLIGAIQGIDATIITK